MFDILIDKNGNFVQNSEEKNAFELTSTTAAYVSQKIRILLKTFLGEYYLDTTIGMPYWDMVDKNPNLKVLQATMKDAILAIDGVSELTSFTMSYTGSSRKLTINFTVKTEDDETVEGTV